jgi:hypothetical protein
MSYVTSRPMTADVISSAIRAAHQSAAAKRQMVTF